MLHKIKILEPLTKRLNGSLFNPANKRGFSYREIAEGYIKSYIEKSEPLYRKYLIEKIKEADRVGRLPAELMTSFSQIALKGKRVRGSLLVLGYEAAGGRDLKSILDVSLFIELIHAGLLVHDDIQDRDDIRRGIKTIHKQFEEVGEKKGLGKDSNHYGISLAINSGISSYFLGMEKLVNAKFSTERIVRASQLTAEYITRVTHGQALDVSNIFVDNVDIEELMNILKYKTAEYTGVLPLILGATLAGVTDKNYLRALRQYGLSLGWAFQIQDDILGTFGDQEELGKTVGTDIKEGKVTLLMLHLAQHGTREQKEFQKSLLGKKNITKSDIEKMQDTLKDCGAYDTVMHMGWDYVKNGEEYIPLITRDKQLQETFQAMLYFMMERTK